MQYNNTFEYFFHLFLFFPEDKYHYFFMDSEHRTHSTGSLLYDEGDLALNIAGEPDYVKNLMHCFFDNMLDFLRVDMFSAELFEYYYREWLSLGVFNVKQPGREWFTGKKLGFRNRTVRQNNIEVDLHLEGKHKNATTNGLHELMQLPYYYQAGSGLVERGKAYTFINGNDKQKSIHTVNFSDHNYKDISEYVREILVSSGYHAAKTPAGILEHSSVLVRSLLAIRPFYDANLRYIVKIILNVLLLRKWQFPAILECADRFVGYSIQELVLEVQKGQQSFLQVVNSGIEAFKSGLTMHRKSIQQSNAENSFAGKFRVASSVPTNKVKAQLNVTRDLVRSWCSLSDTNMMIRINEKYMQTFPSSGPFIERLYEQFFERGMEAIYPKLA